MKIKHHCWFFLLVVQDKLNYADLSDNPKQLWFKSRFYFLLVYLTSHILVSPPIKWDDTTSPTCFARLHPACEHAAQLLMSSTVFWKAQSWVQTDFRIPSAPRQLPLIGIGVFLPILAPRWPVSSCQGQAQPQRAFRNTILPVCSALTTETGVSSPPVCFAICLVPPATVQQATVKQLPKRSANAHLLVSWLQLKAVFSAAAFRVGFEIWLYRLMATRP